MSTRGLSKFRRKREQPWENSGLSSVGWEVIIDARLQSTVMSTWHSKTNKSPRFLDLEWTMILCLEISGDSGKIQSRWLWLKHSGTRKSEKITKKLIAWRRESGKNMMGSGGMIWWGGRWRRLKRRIRSCGGSFSRLIMRMCGWIYRKFIWRLIWKVKSTQSSLRVSKQKNS